MSDVATFLAAVPRILYACRPAAPPPGSEGDAAGLSAHQARLLGYLDPEDPVMVGELAAFAGVTASTMSLTLKRLERDGWIRRDRDPDDRRVMNVTLTEKGERASRARRMLDADRVHRLLVSLDPDRRSKAMIGLRILAEEAEAMIRARPSTQERP